MFKRWKDRKKEGDSPVKNPGNADSQAAEVEASGFICPICMIAYASPDDLQVHFLSVHDENAPVPSPGANGIASPALSNSSWDNQGSLMTFDDETKHQRTDSELSIVSTMKELEEKTAEVLNLQQELNDVNATLKEEKWYTAALKEEVDKLEKEKVENHQTINKLQEESAKMKADFEEKVKLQESLKETAQAECSQLKQELVRVIEAQCGSQAQHDSLAHRTSELAIESTGYKMRYEEAERKRTQLEEELSQLKEQLGTKTKLVENLETQLSERPKGDEIVNLREKVVSFEQQIENMKQSHAKEQKHWLEKYETANSATITLEGKIKEMEIERASKLQQFESLQTALAAGTDSRKQVQDQLQEKQNLIISLQHELNQAGVVQKEKENFVNFLQKELDETKKNLQAETDSKEEAKLIVRNLQSQLEEERRTAATRENQMNELEEAIRQRKDDIRRLQEERTELISKIESGEGVKTAFDQLEQEKSQLVERLSVVETQSQQHIKELSDKIENMYKQINEVNEELVKSRDQTSKLDGTVKELNEKLNSSEQQSTQLREELKAKSESYFTLEKISSTLIADKDKEIAEANNLILQLTTEKNSVTDELGQLKTSFAENQKSWNTEKAQLVNNTEQMKNQLNAKDNRITELENELTACKNKATSVQESLENTNKSLQDELQTSKNQLQEAQLLHQTAKQDLESKLGNLMVSLKNSREKLDDSQAKYEAKVQIQKELETQIAHLEKEQIQTQETIKELAEAHQEKLTNLESQKAEMESTYKDRIQSNEDIIQQLTTQLEGKDQSLLELQRDKERLAEELAKPCEGCKNYEVQLCREQEVYKAEVEKVKGLEHELAVAREDFKHLNKQIDASEEELASVKQNAHETETLLGQTINQLKEVKTALGEKVKEMDQQLKDMYTQQETLNAEKEALESSLSAQKDSYDELLQTKEAIEAQLEVQKAAHERFVEEASEKEQMIISQKLQLQADLTSIQEQMTTMAEKQEEAQEANKRVQNLLKEEAITLQNKLDSEVKEKHETEARLTLQVTSLTENLSAARAEVGKANGRCQELEEKTKEMEKESDHLRGEMMVLEATIHNNQDERRALLERLVGSEEDVEKLRLEVAALQKKLDEAQAAMVELGQENQALQILNNQKNNRRWEKDEQVTNCNNCNKPFSVTVRKHHCRSCGLIFCNECTAKTTVLPASKKPSRVCDSCFGETASPVRG